ncbi:hypothetical protein KP509_33G026000 [Ceratopteris richardii]|uniref:RRM domain-containing protein n=1 Tax=Ceratopteris richardii TaxID=49495 RepID=A0A8T2QP22_CERRI|nr:hypothetical protein KP509_33G026000 [Ceratopteris richardii]KAH7285377.1 hypothetical protein KP509_33G026000 [Ceratopteris richardii]KAH7285378.1 hypothetical protein KP509_33G026000 [Ceratopteris richardii]KAH7285379.1 hypothetical protein KP509_33G026000 [Ceratopteris richardii]KAH7285380.1 hypothetical protein KP509_33G026000 [Ceratopteris richardii]
MDFDEYEYLEKTVQPSDMDKGSNGSVPNFRNSEKGRLSEDVEDGADGRSRSKRHRSGDTERDRSGRKEREHSLRDRSGDRDRERERDRDKERDRERDRDRVRDRDRERDRSERSHRGERGDRSFKDYERDYRDGERRHRSRERDRDRDKDNDTEKEKESERRTHKERSHSRSRDHDRQDKEASKPREMEREHRHPRDRREKKDESAAEPEADPERDQRTVFAFQISLKADERDVYDFFSRAGKVRDVRLIMDRNTRRSKGVGYIEFYDAMSVPMAIALTGQPLLGQPVMVKPSEAEKNLVQSTSTATAGVGGTVGPYSSSARRLYVGNLHFNIAEEQLKQVFEPFGTIELVQLPKDSETGLSKGYGFVQYARLEDARAAQAALNGILELAGRVIKVVPMTDQGTGTEPGLVQGELDDDDGGGLSLTAQSRALLMQKLDRSGTVASVQSIASTAGQVPPPFNLLSGVPTSTVTPSPVVPGLALPGMVGLQNAALGALGGVAEPIGVPTECLLLKNMFDPSTETEPDFDLDIKDEVQTECSKYGVVKHVYVDKNSAGHVYLRFNNMTSAMNAQRALHGRWFAGKMITTSYMTPQMYESKFPDSK